MWPAPLDFWFDLTSPYSWLASTRIEAMGHAAGLRIQWKPLLDRVHASDREHSASPTANDQLRDDWIWEDIQRTANRYHLRFQRPRVYPADVTRAMQIASVALDEGWGPTFIRAAGDALFSFDRDIGDDEQLRTILRDLQQDEARVRARIDEPRIHAQRQAYREEAAAKRIFGAPMFVVGEARFWGNDRLSQAAAYAVGPNAVLLDADDSLERLHFAFRNVISEPDRQLAPRGLRRLHHQILYMCRRHAPLRTSDLSTILALSKQALHGPLSALRDQGLIELRVDPDDGRARRVLLTDEGLAFEDAISNAQRELFRRVAREESPQTQLAFLRMLTALGEGKNARSLLGLPPYFEP